MDLGHKLTDEALAKLEKKIKSAYKLANDEIEQYFAEFDERSKAQKAKFENGEITEQEYKRWRLNEATKGKHYKAIQKSIAEQMNNADKIAVDYINGSMPDIYALNRNYAAYSIEQADLSASFDLVDGSTVKRLIEEDPKLLPNYPPQKAIDFAENSKYFQKQITKQVTTGILLGESNDDIALRLIKNIPNMGKVSAVRNARTATTSAECAGRQDTYESAKAMGIVLKKEWQSAHDARTRDAHIAADGQKVEVEQPFIVGGERLMNPGDPSGSAWNIMNCRCTTVADIDTKASAKNKNPVSFNKWVEEKREQASMPQFTPAKTRQEAEQYALKFANSVDYKGISADNCNEVNKALTHLFSTYKVDKYETILPKAYNNAIASANYSRLGVNGKRLGKDLESGMDVFRQSQKNAQETIDLIKQRFEGKKMPWAQEHTIEELEKILKFNRYGVCDTCEDKIAATITHEFGHTLSDQYIGMINHEKANPHYDTNWALRARCETWSKTFNKAIENGDIYKISQYASKNYREFFAECFVMYDRGEKLPDYIYDLMKGTIENGML